MGGWGEGGSLCRGVRRGGCSGTPTLPPVGWTIIMVTCCGCYS